MRRRFYLIALASFFVPAFNHAISEEGDEYFEKLLTFTDYSEKDEQFFFYLRTFNDANDEESEQFYEKLRNTAANCINGQIIKRGDGCSKCTCIWTGLISCTTNGCPLKEPEQVEELKDEEDDNEETTPLTSQTKSYQSLGKKDKIKDYNKLRGDARNCVEGVIVKKYCMLCQCIIIDIMSCVNDPECKELSLTKIPVTAVAADNYDY